MQATERPEFTPPPEGGLTRSIGMALLAHAVLVLGLSWGVKWKRDDSAVMAEAELWANAPVQAAPKPVEAPPAPPPPPPAPPQPTQAQRDAEIALERERERKEAEEKARREEAERQKQLAERKRQQQEEARKQEQARRAEEKRKEEQARARREQEEEKRLAELRTENMKRMQGMAGATGARESTGTALRSAGPSASYAGRLSAHFQRHVVFPGGVDTIVGNPQAVVQVRVSPTGEIVSARLSRSSGNAAWDEAAVRAIERSERIPPDVDGRYVSEFPVEMRPKR
ncbi:cell envelope integrity protein TolA [Ramlibacter henchirensis]|uniref:Cell envelope integrity protein TolA n=1 Tax=Ramlibacter henchirensis TaxID=204072 RepID=A0A4Z0BS70_9BURK|nr:cell envelope integrity protein TolA [Ramlibacter henchirensis]TFZ02146.1 cell envelope integrity protein TolA [Ramlibacter henchirensis]